MWDAWGSSNEHAVASPASLSQRLWVIEITIIKSGRTAIAGVMSSLSSWFGLLPAASLRSDKIAISLSPVWSGQGIGSLAQQLLAQHLHAEGAVRVEACTNPENIAERKALAKAGFRAEGTLCCPYLGGDFEVWSHYPGQASLNGTYKRIPLILRDMFIAYMHVHTIYNSINCE